MQLNQKKSKTHKIYIAGKKGQSSRLHGRVEISNRRRIVSLHRTELCPHGQLCERYSIHKSHLTPFICPELSVTYVLSDVHTVDRYTWRYIKHYSIKR